MSPQTQITPVNVAAVGSCDNSFFGFPTWYKYLDLDQVQKVDENNNPVYDTSGNGIYTCEIVNFQLLGKGSDSGLLLVSLAIIDILLRLAALVAVAFVIVGGFKYMTAQGEPGAIKSATQTLVGAVGGLLLAILAVAVVSFIGNSIT